MAWDEVKAHYYTPTSVELARLRLANTTLAVYGDSKTDPDALKAAGHAGSGLEPSR